MKTRIIILLALILSSFSVQAADYHVELIIFENLRPPVDGEISWSNFSYPDYSDSIELISGAGTDTAFKQLASGFYKLGGVYTQLKASGSYRPLLHMAWQQPALYGGNARAVHVVKTDPGAADNTAAASIKIDGTVRVRAAQFLHADVDLLYFPEPRSQTIMPTAADGTVTGAAQQAGYSRMRESRRMKLNELHYFDHPLFGMILHISRAAAD